MLLTMKEALSVAQKHKFALGAYNIGNHEILRVVIDQCLESNAPCILAVHPDELEYLTDGFIEYIKYEARRVSIPVVLHLDHGANLDQIKRAVKCGFTSVMIDASHKSFEENIAITQEVVNYTKEFSVSVEAELGTIGDLGETLEGGTPEIVYTEPEKALEFVKQTGIDTLAVAVGTSHGIYPKHMTPKIQTDLITEIKQIVDIPLVLHGGSSNPDNEITESVRRGICKVNISSDIKNALFQGAKMYLNNHEGALEPLKIFPDGIHQARAVLKHKFSLLNCLDKVRYY
ncbi:MAG: ketose-bisphosphate aldolase [Brevinema sp.]